MRAIQIGLDLAKEIGLRDPWHFSPGGGWGVAYHEEELPNPDIDAYVQVDRQNPCHGAAAAIKFHCPSCTWNPVAA